MRCSILTPMADAAPATGFDVGTIVGGTYKITGLLGKGGMGSVWAAEHSRLPGKKVAIKVLHAEVAGDHESLARFRREAEIASRLGHANIVDVHDFNTLDDGTPYLILEFLEGEDLSERLARGPLPLAEVNGIIRQVCSALRAAHREGIIHRDLKPQNVFLCPIESGGVVTERAKVLDFGISKIRGSQTIKTNATDMLGTPQYMAPEQATGNHAAVDGRTDIFALGAMVYEMLAGQPAFQGQSIPEVVFKVVYEDAPNLGDLVSLPPGVVDAIHKALSKKQEDRFADVSEFVHALTGSTLTTLSGQVLVVPSDGSSAGAPTHNAAIGDAATCTPARAPVGYAPTIASGEHERFSKPVGSAPTVNDEATPVAKKSKLWIVVAGAIAAAAGVGGFIALGGGGTSTPAADKTPVAVVTPPPQPIDAGVPLADAAPTAAAAKVDAAVDKSKKPVADPTKKPIKKPADNRTPEQQAKLDKALAAARAKLEQGNDDMAIVLARRSQRVDKSDQAFEIMARAYCNKHDLGMARSNYRNIRNRKLKQQVISFCRSKEVDLR